MSLEISALKNFIENPVWIEFQSEMKAMRDIVFETTIHQTDPYQVFKALGRAEVLGDLISWADVQLTNAEGDKSKEGN